MSTLIHSRPADPYVEKNQFRTGAYAPITSPAFSQAKSLLPQPVLPDYPEWVEMYWRAWELIWTHLRHPKADGKVAASYVHVGTADHLFMWDTAFMVQATIYGRQIFDFTSALDNFYARQHDDGFICRELDPVTGDDLYYPFDPDGTGPNVLAWAEWRCYRAAGDDARLTRVFWPLLAYHRWLREHRTWQSGLYWTTGESSGLSNQPRVPDSRHHHRHWAWVDASMQATLNCTVLAQMAAWLQEEEIAALLTAERARLTQLINAQMWNPEQNFYQDIDANGRFSRVKSIGAFWGLVDKTLVPPDRLGLFVQHLRDSWSFNLPHRVPSQAADSEGYNAQSGNYWRGAVWPMTNFVVLKGLRTIGQHKLAHAIALNHLRNVCEVYQHTDTFWENYAPETAVAGSPAQASAIGTASLTSIAMLLEDVVGLHVDWPLRRVSWDRRLQTSGEYGVRNFPVGPNGSIDLISNGSRLFITTDVPFTLQIRENGELLQVAVPVGTTELDLH